MHTILIHGFSYLLGVNSVVENLEFEKLSFSCFCCSFVLIFMLGAEKENSEVGN